MWCLNDLNWWSWQSWWSYCFVILEMFHVILVIQAMFLEILVMLLVIPGLLVIWNCQIMLRNSGVTCFELKFLFDVCYRAARITLNQKLGFRFWFPWSRISDGGIQVLAWFFIHIYPIMMQTPYCTIKIQPWCLWSVHLNPCELQLY